MEKQPLLPIRLIRDDNEDKVDRVIQVKDNLNELLGSPTIVNMEPRQNSKLSIYKIPHFMRETHSKSFNPQLVSFGPYHHGKPHLLPMEKEKLKAFHDFKTNNRLDVESIVKSVSSILDDLLRSYDNLEEEWTEKQGMSFLQLMIVDGCFMLQFFNKCLTSLEKMSADITRDMLLLENQLPMKLIDELYCIANRDQPPSQAKDLKSLVCNSLGISQVGLMAEYSHILEMYRASLLYPPIDRKNWSGKEYKQSDPEFQIIRPTTQLREAGIKFEKNDKNKCLTDVTFDEKQGVLRLPQLVVDDDTESNFLNVMAFEKLHFEAESRVTSFVVLMNNLIDDDRDVALLASEKILANALGNDNDAADLFNRLGNGAALELDSHMLSVHEMVNKHCNKTLNKWCASLKHDYFQNPWTIISIFAAMLGFVLLILQAAYQLFDYYLKV